MAEQTQTQIKAYSRPKTAREGGSTVINYNISGAFGSSSNIDAKSATINRIKSELIDTNTINANNGNFVYLVASDGTISTLRGASLDYESGNIDDLHSSVIHTNEINATTGNITNLFNEYLQGKEIVTDYLTVNKSAHFFEVIVDKIRSVGGTIINTACNSTIDYVLPLNANDQVVSTNPTKYRCFFKRTQDDGTYITNDWLINDQAICQSCNLVPGTSYNKGTHYYWRLVKGRNNENAPVYVNFNTGEVDYESTTQPDYSVVFVDNSGTIFTYSDNISSTVTDYTCTADIPADKTIVNNNIKLKIEDTIHGLNVVPNKIQNGTVGEIDYEQDPPVVVQVPNMYKPVMMGGGKESNGEIIYPTFSFETANPTRLNVAFIFDDGTIEYHPIGSIIVDYNADNNTNLNTDKDYLTQYDVKILQEKNINYISITSDEVNVWNSCHWIDLSNLANEYDTPTHLDGNNYDMAPVAGDNIAQLGYRYGNNPTQDEKDRASAIIIAAYKTPDAEITPPSYAQYKNITDFSLSSHRHTYFDANGSKFYGNFYIGTGDNTGSYTPVSDLDAEVYKIVPNYDIITKDINDVITPSTLTCQFLVPNQANLSNTVPTGCSFNYTIDNGSPVTISAGNTVSINISNMSSNIILVLTKNNVIMDQITKSVVEIDVANGENGLNGPITQWAYKNAVSQPTDLPTAANSDTYINNWTSAAVPLTAQQISSGYATWQRQRTNTWTLVNNVNVKSYGQWSDAVRLTGQNGQPGEDGDPGSAGANGKYVEFIYKRFTSAQTFENNNNNPAYWSANQTPDYTGPTGYQWNDNPQGITETYKYEYMSQREYDGTAFGTFTTPVIWSKWGEKGQDGDGYEYIYNTYEVEQSWGNNNYNPAYWSANQNDDYLGPTGYQWLDDPIGVNDDLNKVEYVSVRKKTNGVWGTFSTPALWAQYVPQGTNGGRYQLLYANFNPSSPSTQPSIIPTGYSEYSISALMNAGWSRAASTPNFANGEYTYMTQAFFNDGQTSAVWTEPARITGNNGKEGEDGTDFEFIYTRNNGTLSNGVRIANPPDAPFYDSGGNTINDQDDWYGTDIDGVYWTDNPQGVQANLQFEYMVQRKKLPGNSVWEDYAPSVAAVWAKWGEKGQDGDGYEYVFLKHWEDTCPTIYDDDTYTKSGVTISKTDDDYCPYSTVRGQKVRWNDEPDEPDTTGKYVFVSMRKKINGTWENFSPGKLWTWYVENGAEGPTGPQGETGPQGQTGPAGENAVKYELVDQDSYTNLIMDLDPNTNEIVSQLDISLKFRVTRREGETVRYMNANEMSNMAVYYRMCQTDQTTPVYYYNKLTLTTSGNSIAEYSVSYQSSNTTIIDRNKDIIVALVGATTTSISDANITNYTMHDTVNFIVALQPVATLNIVQGQNASIRGLVTGQQGINQQFSVMTQTMSGIQATVNNISSDYVTDSELNVAIGNIEMQLTTGKAGGINWLNNTLFSNNKILGINTTFISGNTASTNSSGNRDSVNSWWMVRSNNIVNAPMSPTSILTSSKHKYIGMPALTFKTSQIPTAPDAPNVSLYDIVPSTLFENDSNTNSTYTFSIFIKRTTDNGGDKSVLLGLYGPNMEIESYAGDILHPADNITVTNTHSDSGTSIYRQWNLNDYNNSYDDDTAWHRLFITFSRSTITDIQAYVRIYGGNSSLSNNDYVITMPQFNPGGLQEWAYGEANGLLNTGIDITNGQITLNANNTVIDGDLNLRGNFVSEDTTYMNRITADASQGGMKFEGPDHVGDNPQDPNLPNSGAQYTELVNIKFETENQKRVGVIDINGNFNNGNQAGKMRIDPAGNGILYKGQNSQIEYRDSGVYYEEHDDHNNVINTFLYDKEGLNIYRNYSDNLGQHSYKDTLTIDTDGITFTRIIDNISTTTRTKTWLQLLS